MSIKSRFTDHPASVGETYGEHFRVALHFSYELGKASVAAAAHAFYPCVCLTRASDAVKTLGDEMTSGARGEAAAAREAHS